MSLVADYGNSSPSESESSSLSSSSDLETLDIQTKSTTEPATTEKLPTPDFCDFSHNATHSKNSVFSNPFKEEENAKQAILEKHVKMVNMQENVKTINGKKICWNYRKGRCRFGHNCIYAHDSDIQKNNESNETSITKSTVCKSTNQVTPFELAIENKASKGKKRPGLTQGLVPGKRVMKAYHNQRDKPLFLKQK